MRPEFVVGALGASVLFGLALAQAATLLPSCGLRLGPFGDLVFCRAPAAGEASPELAAELERRAALEDRLRGLERRLAGLAACPPPEPVAGPEPPAQAQAEPEPEGLDEKRWREKDISLLEGCWALASNYRLRDRRTGSVTGVATWEMCFDAEGNGDQRLVQTDGRECTGDVSASFGEDGQLGINDPANVRCTGGFHIYRRMMTCTLEPNGEAACESRQPEIGGRSNVRIMRRDSR